MTSGGPFVWAWPPRCRSQRSCTTSTSAYLKGAGVNVKRDGNLMHLMAMTDKDVQDLSSGPLEHAKATDARTNEPIRVGSLTWPLTGGHHGNRWAHIESA
jgi:hypothetical protein